MHEFVVLRNGARETYTRFEDIPESFDNLIKFAPHVPPGPHTHEQHEEIEGWNDRLRELMGRETR